MSRESKNEEATRVIINSANRTDLADLTSDFTYALDKQVSKVVAIEVVSVQIPFSYYAINGTNDQLSSFAGLATLIHGNYTSASFAAMVEAQLNLLAAGHTVTYSSVTGRITVANAGNTRIIVSGVNDAAPLLGFTVSSALAASVTGDSTAVFTGPNYLVIKSLALTRYNSTPAVTAADLASTTIFHTVPVNVNAGAIIIDTPESNSSMSPLNFPDNFNEIDLQLEDDQGNQLDLNGANWSMQLLMHAR